MNHDTSADVVSPALLRGLVVDLPPEADDAPKALERVWAGLRVARLLGLRLARTGAPWHARQVNAECVEHQIATDFTTSATFARVPLVLPTPDGLTGLRPDEVDDAVGALVAFGAAARAHMLAAAPRADRWHDERVLRHDSLVIADLGPAWLGERRGYVVARPPLW
ncbi:hypothetical protein [Actinosynnema sp. NPDC020468]|uniref:hypothetical protein n=1 Tax=Actinosynnema sp. NPDC020468 TaxID=3154488 RepID=UPI0033C70926